jgi:hypothetical protein
MRHPEVESKILSEAEAVLGPLRRPRPADTNPRPAPAPSGPPGGDPTCAPAAGGVGQGGGGAGGEAAAAPLSYERLQALRYARAVFLEGLRLHPSVPQVGRGLPPRGDQRTVGPLSAGAASLLCARPPSSAVLGTLPGKRRQATSQPARRQSNAPDQPTHLNSQPTNRRLPSDQGSTMNFARRLRPTHARPLLFESARTRTPLSIFTCPTTTRTSSLPCAPTCCPAARASRPAPWCSTARTP